jgi:short-subunit dehydrogenase
MAAEQKTDISLKKYGPWAVIAGASEGIGSSMAARLAREGFNLVLIARKPEPLEEVAKEIRSAYKVQVRPLPLDLTAPDLLDQVRKVTDDVEVGLLCYNAGNPKVLTRFVDKTLEEATWPIRLCAISLTVLTHHFGLKMAKRGRGGLIFTSSLGGFAGMPYITTYCGAKGFVQIFTESLWAEMRPLGVDVLCYSVGLTETPSMRRNLTGGPPPGAFIADPDDIAKAAFEDLQHDRGPIRFPPQEAERVQQLMWLPRRALLEMTAVQPMGDGKAK